MSYARHVATGLVLVILIVWVRWLFGEPQAVWMVNMVKGWFQ